MMLAQVSVVTLRLVPFSCTRPKESSYRLASPKEKAYILRLMQRLLKFPFLFTGKPRNTISQLLRVDTVRVPQNSSHNVLFFLPDFSSGSGIS